MYQRFGVFADADEVAPARNRIDDPGRLRITRVARDARVFRVPSLRNVAVTAPYFHDGRTRTLGAAVRTMAKAQLGRTLDAHEIDALVAFLETLTGGIAAAR